MMSREILFKAKGIDNGEWVEGYPIFYPSGKCVFYKKAPTLPDSLFHCDVDLSTVTQYTGLKDKNGKRIFEGDILKAVITGDCPIPYREVFKEVVLWDEHDKCFCMREKDSETLVPFSQCILEDVEIIGNIFDNPEMMGGAEG